MLPANFKILKEKVRDIRMKKLSNTPDDSEVDDDGETHQPPLIRLHPSWNHLVLALLN